MALDPDQPHHHPPLDHCRLSADALDRAVPLDGRWPEPRLLHQTTRWYGRDRTPWHLASLTPDGLRELLDGLLQIAPVLHEQAACDEVDQTSPWLEWAYDELGVLMIFETDPVVWIESTELVRWLRARS